MHKQTVKYLTQSILMAFFFVGMIQISFAQSTKGYTLKGYVLNKETREAIPFASLVINSNAKGVTTDLEGKYKFTSLPSSEFTLNISCIGFKDNQVSVHLNANKELNILLEEEAVSLEEVTVVGESEASKIEAQGFAVNSVKVGKIQTQSIQLNDVIDQSSGLIVRQSGGLGAKASYSMNGLSGDAVRFFIDGIPMEYYGSAYSINSLPVSLIENVQIFKGVVPAHLMSDALGGAINIITKKESQNALNASYSVGSFNTHQVSVNGNWRDQKSGLTFRASAFYNYSDNNYEVWGDDEIYITDPETLKPTPIVAERFNNAYENKGGKIDVGFTGKSWADQLLFSMTYADKYQEVQHGATMVVPYNDRYYTQESAVPSLSYNKSDFILKNVDLSLFTAYSMKSRTTVDTTGYFYNWHGQPTTDGRDKSLSYLDENTFINKLTVDYHLNEQHSFTFSQLYSIYDRFSDDVKAEIEDRTHLEKQEITKNLIGLSYQASLFDHRLKTNLFWKYYGYDIYWRDTEFDTDTETYIPSDLYYQDPQHGYGFAASFKINPKWELRGSIEKAVRLPNANELFGNASENILPAEIEGGALLQPEKSNNINLGASYQTSDNKVHHFKVAMNLFYRDVTDMIQAGTETVGGVEYFIHVNHSNILSKGVDLQVDYSHLKKLNVSLSASYNDARNKDKYSKDGKLNNYYNDRLRNEPYFKFNADIRYKFDDLIQTGSQLTPYWTTRYVHEFYNGWESAGQHNRKIIPSQLVHNMGVTYRFPNQKLACSLDVKNIFNEQIYDNYALQLPGRGVYFKLNYNIL